MAKDPAVLFYTSDFLTGVATLSDDQIGKYIRLLCLQHQRGHLPEKDMLFICKSYDEDIFIKFTKDDVGKYFNKRMDAEIEKRSKYSESRSANRKKKDMSNISDSYDEHMENENEDVNSVDTIVEKRVRGKPFVQPTPDEVAKYCTERGRGVNPSKWYDHYTSNGWLVGKNKMKDWKSAVRTWEPDEAKKPAKAEPEEDPRAADWSVEKANENKKHLMQIFGNQETEW